MIIQAAGRAVKGFARVWEDLLSSPIYPYVHFFAAEHLKTMACTRRINNLPGEILPNIYKDKE
ncbi:hypothetical protein [Klebsiella phage PhiKpNIH-10]|uniref:Uncharacterized protein n=1 Tax=Klebsiella phage PhiKpNIH-10 TaxID=2689113 RepID=A0A6B9LQG0_9CAUD|nr:hypothetical protein [Klebsiella phage PhiKpNIH-10]